MSDPLPYVSERQSGMLTPLGLLVSLDMANTKPLVAAAFFCENLLEQEGGVISAIRIVDTYHVQVPPDMPSDTHPVIQIKGLISLKSGDVVGPSAISVVLENSLGERAKLGEWPVVFAGGESGVQLKMNFPLGIKNFGLCWFDVFWGEDILTRIPLMLRQAQTPVESQSSS